MTKHFAVFVILAVGLLGRLPATSWAADLVSHRAFYVLSLHSADSRSGIVGAPGAMVIEWVDACEGWSSSQRLTLFLQESSGHEIETDIRFASWESKDGLYYRFNVRSLRAGQLFEKIGGSAELPAPGMKGAADFTSPEAKTVVLPKGTLFPTTHLIGLIEAAEKGEKIFSRVVFDGATEDGLFDVNAVIGKPVPLEEPIRTLDSSLDRDYWPIRLAFFNVTAGSMLPDYESTIFIADNGVTRELLLDYGEFIIQAILHQIKILPKEPC